MPRQVTPKEARTGAFIDSWPVWEYAAMMRALTSMVALQKQTERRTGVKSGELVFCAIHAWGHDKRHDTWQVFLLPRKD